MKKVTGSLSPWALFVGICAASSLSGTAGAQNAQVANADSLSLEEVVVTGSRVISNGNDSPTPVTVLSVDQLLLANPGNIATAMNMLPSVMGTPTQGGQSSTNFQAVINLRGMGGQRNLVLFDGHRVAPTTGATGVDSNLIPSMLLKRVDVVTGGASAVYGSDAVSGVINYIVDNNFNGVKFNAQQSMSTYHDAKAYSVGIALGTPLFGGRGHIEFSYQRNNDPGVPDRYSREWGRGVWSMQGTVPGSTASAGSEANPYALFKDSRFNVTNFGGMINPCTGTGCTNPLGGLQFAQNGVLSPFNRGTRTGSPQVDVGGDGGYFTTYPAFGAQKLDQALGRFDFNFTDDVKGYAEIVAASALNENTLANAEVRTKVIGYNNAYLGTVQPVYQAVIAAQLAANPLSNFNFSRIFTADQVPAPVNNALGKQIMLLSGIEGSWNDYKWDIGYEHSDSSFTTTNPYNISNARLYAAMNAVTVTAANVGTSGRNIGSIACNAALVNPAVYGNCVPLNLFGPTATNQAAYDYIRQQTEFVTRNSMDDVTASIAGAPLNSWAGPMEMALSADWRQQSYERATNAQTTDPVNCTGIQFNCNASTSPYFGAVANIFPKAKVTVYELAYETQVPLLKDRLFAKSLAVNGAVRYTNYETSGPVWTWKLGLNWALNDTLNMRATRSRDIRAPNQANLFAPASAANLTITDVHTGVTGTVPSFTQGNPNLKPEQADTWTVGLVWTPQFLEGFSMSLDGYRIDLVEALNGLSPTQPATQQACEASNGASPVCDLYIRPFPFSDHSTANFPIRVLNQTLNTGGLLTYGVDTEISYSHPISGRRFDTRLLVNYQPHLVYDVGPAGIYDVGGSADGIAGLLMTPNVKGMLQVNYEVMNNFTVTLQERYRNAMKQHGSPLLFFAIGKQPPVWYTDMNMGYKLRAGGGNMDVFLNIRNLFNKQPEPWAASGANGQVGSLGGYVPGDDIIGRYFTLGLRYKM